MIMLGELRVENSELRVSFGVNSEFCTLNSAFNFRCLGIEHGKEGGDASNDHSHGHNPAENGG